VRDAVAELLLRGGCSPWLAAKSDKKGGQTGSDGDDNSGSSNSSSSSGGIYTSREGQNGAINNGVDADFFFSSSSSGDNKNMETKQVCAPAVPLSNRIGANDALRDGTALFVASSRSSSGIKTPLRILATKV
jgi:hypothetical protein